MHEKDLQIIVMTGMSGSGKSVALRALEDAGFHCVDNLPPELLSSFIDIEKQHGGGKIGIAIDARQAASLPRLPEQLRALRASGLNIRSIFLDAHTEVLVHRFSETRRLHPLSFGNNEQDPRHALTDAIEMERDLLANLREQSHVIDSSLIRSAQLQSTIKQLVSASGQTQLTLVFESFGFKRGIPLDADYVFDVRMLPNPHYEADLRLLTGRDQPVADYLKAQADVRHMFSNIHDFVKAWLPKLAQDHRSYVTVAIGCTGGQHRSVFLVEQLADEFAKTHTTLKRHREMDGNLFASSVL
jgi:RNase adapter protein RapZ